jgi:hypothetical protein
VVSPVSPYIYIYPFKLRNPYILGVFGVFEQSESGLTSGLTWSFFGESGESC